jgi:SAM-dependent methyltransferase
MNYSDGLGYFAPDFLFEIYNEFIPRTTKTVLDVGSGDGIIVTNSMPNFVQKVYCVEPWVEQYQKLKKTIVNEQKFYTTNRPLELLHEPLSNWPQTFDCITISKWCIDFDKRQDVLNTCYKLLTKGGVLIITCVENYLVERFDDYENLYLHPLIVNAGFRSVYSPYLYETKEGGCWVLVYCC